MVYHTSLTNTTGKTKDLMTRNTLFNMHNQRLIRGKVKLVNTQLDQDKNRLQNIDIIIIN